jgi:hypothetical protein
MMTGSWAVVSEATGIPQDTLRHWKMQPWWKDFESQIRNQRHVEVSGKLKRLIDKTMAVVEDRVENGNWHYNPRTQKIERRPVNAREAGEILNKALDKEVILSKLIEKPVQQEEAVMDRLKSIEARLLEAAKIKREVTIIDVEPIQEGIDSSSLPVIKSKPASVSGSGDESGILHSLPAEANSGDAGSREQSPVGESVGGTQGGVR